MKISPSVPVLVLAGAQEDLVPADARLLREAVALLRQARALRRHRRRRRLVDAVEERELEGPVGRTSEPPDADSGCEALQLLRYTATDFSPSDHPFSNTACTSSTLALSGRLIVFEIRAAEEGLHRRHHLEVRLVREAAIEPWRGEGAVEDGEVLVVEVSAADHGAVLLDVRED